MNLSAADLNDTTPMFSIDGYNRGQILEQILRNRLICYNTTTCTCMYDCYNVHHVRVGYIDIGNLNVYFSI